MAYVGIGILGLGTVGSGVVRLLADKPGLSLKNVVVRDKGKLRQVQAPCTISSDVSHVMSNPAIDVVVEVMGGEHPALEYIVESIKRGKHIVTANKEVLAKHGPALFNLARENGVALLFEAAVAGGIPLISTIHRGLEATKLVSVSGILNGTTNYILTQMEKSAETFSSALSKAQSLGYAESNPISDINGDDVAYKLSVLSALAFGQFVRPVAIYKEGISAIRPEDIKLVNEFGYRIKLIGISKRGVTNHLDVRLHPMLVPIDHPFATVADSQNGVLISTEAIDEIFIVGPGAGQLPTASAVVGDIVNLARALKLQDFTDYFNLEAGMDWMVVSPAEDFVCPYYLRFSVLDLPGVIGHIGTVFGKYQISINSIVQKEVVDGQAEVIIFTQDAKDSNIISVLNELKKTDFLQQVFASIRIFKR